MSPVWETIQEEIMALETPVVALQRQEIPLSMVLVHA